MSNSATAALVLFAVVVVGVLAVLAVVSIKPEIASSCAAGAFGQGENATGSWDCAGKVLNTLSTIVFGNEATCANLNQTIDYICHNVNSILTFGTDIGYKLKVAGTSILDINSTGLAVAAGHYLYQAVSSCAAHNFLTGLNYKTQAVCAQPSVSDLSGGIQQLGSSLVGYWPMDEGTGTTTADFSGNANTGTFSATPPVWTSTGCKFGSCLVFTAASSETVNVPNSASMQFATAFSDTFWVTDSTVANQGLFGVVFTGVNLNYRCELLASMKIQCLMQNAGGASSTITTTVNTYADGNPHFVAFTYDGSNMHLSVDTTSVTPVAFAITTTAKTQFQIGASNYDGTFCTCTIDNFKAYSFALSTAQISTDFAATNPTTLINGMSIYGTFQNSQNFQRIVAAALTNPSSSTVLNLPIAEPDTSYAVVCTSNAATPAALWVTAKSTTQFTVNYAAIAVGTDTVDCIVTHQ